MKHCLLKEQRSRIKHCFDVFNAVITFVPKILVKVEVEKSYIHSIKFKSKNSRFTTVLHFVYHDVLHIIQMYMKLYIILYVYYNIVLYEVQYYVYDIV